MFALAFFKMAIKADCLSFFDIAGDLIKPNNSLFDFISDLISTKSSTILATIFFFVS